MNDQLSPTPCRVVVDGDENESFLVCLTCDPYREVCCGHHLAPHDEDGCHETVASSKCRCSTRRSIPAADVDPQPEPQPWWGSDARDDDPPATCDRCDQPALTCECP